MKKVKLMMKPAVKMDEVGVLVSYISVEEISDRYRA
jgi:hypothetical protein